jgi:hypothetical protein
MPCRAGARELHSVFLFCLRRENMKTNILFQLMPRVIDLLIEDIAGN